MRAGLYQEPNSRCGGHGRASHCQPLHGIHVPARHASPTCPLFAGSRAPRAEVNVWDRQRGCCGRRTGRNQGRGDSPQGQEKQESGHEGCHGNAVAQVVDHVGDVVVQFILPLLDRQTYGQTEAWGTRKAVLSTPVMATLYVLTRRAEGLLHAAPCIWFATGWLLVEMAAVRPPDM